VCLTAVLGLGACATDSGVPRSSPLRSDAPESDVPLVGTVVLSEAPAQVLPLDVAVAVFDQGLDVQTVDGAVFPTIRKAESLVLPVILSQTLEDSGTFGVVRVTPDTAVSMPLVLSARIIRADGLALELEVRLEAIDGRQLLEKTYRDEAQEGDYRNAREDPFADLYRAISNDVQTAVLALGDEQRGQLQRLALMRFGASLSPVTFDRFLTSDEDGYLALAGFPAAGDPMLTRLLRLRRQDDLFIDAADEQYSDLLDTVGESYDLWRAYAFELETYGAAYRESAASRRSDARRGSFAAMQQVYATFRKVKLQEEDLNDLVAGFGGEALETVMTTDDGVYRLSGSVASRYEQWRGILSQIYALETGLPAGQSPE
jgi:hypothetical protein